MQTIKFRVWDRISQKMEIVTAIVIEDNVAKYVKDTGHTISRTIGKECDLMQFTGLLDKNGKEIYEEDMIRLGPDNFKDVLGIRFHSGVFGVIGRDSRHYPLRDFIHGTFEVIGNIYENHELLK